MFVIPEDRYPSYISHQGNVFLRYWSPSPTKQRQRGRMDFSPPQWVRWSRCTTALITINDICCSRLDGLQRWAASPSYILLTGTWRRFEVWSRTSSSSILATGVDSPVLRLSTRYCSAPSCLIYAQSTHCGSVWTLYFLPPCSHGFPPGARVSSHTTKTC